MLKPFGGNEVSLQTRFPEEISRETGMGYLSWDRGCPSQSYYRGRRVLESKREKWEKEFRSLLGGQSLCMGKVLTLGDRGKPRSQGLKGFSDGGKKKSLWNLGLTGSEGLTGRGRTPVKIAP